MGQRCVSSSLIFLCLFLTACNSTPVSRKATFEVDWIRSTLNRDYFGFLHSERTSPYIDGDIVYAANGIDGVVAFDKTTAHQIWRLDIQNGVESGFYSDDESIFFGASDGQFYSVNKGSGKIAWTFPSRTENLATPLVTNGVVYFFLAGNNVLYAVFDSKAGKQLHQIYNRGEASSLEHPRRRAPDSL